jgi:hypothetical protein
MLAVKPLCAKEKWSVNPAQALPLPDDFGAQMLQMKQAESGA